MRGIAWIVLLVGLATWPATAHGDSITRGAVIQSTDVVVSEQRLLLVHSVRRTNTLLPPNLVRLEIRFPPGSQVHTARFPRCDIVRLQAKGTGGCPRRARVGSASVVGRSVLDSHVGSKVTMFHGERVEGRRTVLMYVDPEKGPAFFGIGKVYGSRRSGVRLDLAFPPPITTLAVAGPDAVMSDFALRFRTSFLSAPCPATYRVTSTFSDELAAPILTSADRARCR